MKTYRTTKGQLSLPYNGKRIVFECRDFPFGYYTTNDKGEQNFIEGLKDFGVYIFIDKEEKVETPKKEMTIIEVEGWQDAKNLLIEKGLKASDVNSPNKIKSAGTELGIEFKLR
ncbi:MAG: hypothetical protein IJ341_00270 [Bacteroidales bacterium]|nr:hypothetical protein [Bacteroidales bacterium]